jgi:hypothetical protein
MEYFPKTIKLRRTISVNPKVFYLYRIFVIFMGNKNRNALLMAKNNIEIIGLKRLIKKGFSQLK